jgi:hypothetical protein
MEVSDSIRTLHPFTWQRALKNLATVGSFNKSPERRTVGESN